MTSSYGEPSTPDLSDLQQLEDEYGIIRVPVKVTEVCEPVHTNSLPAREAVMRSYVIPAGTMIQLLGRDLRRKSVKVWGLTADTAATAVYIGTDKNEVESETSALLPVLLDDLTLGTPMVLEMTHVKEMWVKNTHSAEVTISFVAEYWAD